jgi:hypothetical protein
LDKRYTKAKVEEEESGSSCTRQLAKNSHCTKGQNVYLSFLMAKVEREI